MDRLTPTRPPAGHDPAGYQTWTHLLFAHWEVDPSVMRAVVPAELDLDLWEGRAYVGVVPFAMRDIRPAFVPRGLGLNFLETNLRTYVSYRGEPGVFFFSLEASSLLAVKAARWGWGLPYFHAEMSASFDDCDVRRVEGEGLRPLVLTGHPAGCGEGAEQWARSTRGGERPAVLDARWIVDEPIGPVAPDSLEFFLLERYYLFAPRKGRVYKGHVHHTPYPAHRARVLSMECGLIEAAGLPAVTRPPDVVHASPGVEVAVFGPWPVR